MRIGVGGLYHESHAFAAELTSLSDFELVRGEQFFHQYAGTRTSMAGFLGAAPTDWDVHPLLYATATPSGALTREAYRSIRDELVRKIKVARLDGLFLILHGAMCVDDMVDAESDLLGAVRGCLPPGAPIVVTIDLHANVSERFVELVDAVVSYKTYPHVDPYERAVDATGILDRIMRGQVRPVTAVRKLPLVVPVQAGETGREPIKSAIDLAVEMEARAHVLSASVVCGFPYGDEPRVGPAFIVTTDDRSDLASALADELAQYVWERREQLRVRNYAPEQAVKMASAAPRRPVVLVDVSDNVGGGSAADGTAILEQLFERKTNSALVTINDPEAVQWAKKAGLGGDFDGVVGGKTDDLHGPPVRVRGQVTRLLDDGRIRFQGPYMTGLPHDMGPAAVVHSQGIDIVLTSERTPPFDAAYLTALDVDPKQYGIIVAKSAIAWQAAFGPIAAEAIMVDGPGITTVQLDTLPYKRLPRPIFPLDEL